MSDITKCSGFNCPLKNNCKRYKSIDGMWQSYFTECEFFWGEQNESILNQLNKIMK